MARNVSGLQFWVVAARDKELAKRERKSVYRKVKIVYCIEADVEGEVSDLSAMFPSNEYTYYLQANR